MSPRAAWQLERLGFDEVYDYVAGKADWLAAGRSTQRRDQGPPRVIDAIDRDVPTCAPDDRLPAVAGHFRELTRTSCVVVNANGIVLGRLRLDSDHSPEDVTAGEAMDPGPATVRADALLGATRERLVARGVRDILVTTPDGELLGVLHRDAE